MRWNIVARNPENLESKLACGYCRSEISISDHRFPANNLGGKPTVFCTTCCKNPHLPGPHDRQVDLEKAQHARW